MICAKEANGSSGKFPRGMANSAKKGSGSDSISKCFSNHIYWPLEGAGAVGWRTLVVAAMKDFTPKGGIIKHNVVDNVMDSICVLAGEWGCPMVEFSVSGKAWDKPRNSIINAMFVTKRGSKFLGCCVGKKGVFAPPWNGDKSYKWKRFQNKPIKLELYEDNEKSGQQMPGD